MQPDARINLDPRAWAKKYFIAPSFSESWFEINIRGMNEIKFNSRPTQIKIQWFEDKEIKDPTNREDPTKKENGRKDI